MKQILIILVVVNIVAIILTVGLWTSGYEVAGAVLGMGGAAGWLVLVVFGAFAAGSWWSRVLMESGANVALRAQESDDRRDTAMIAAISKLAGWWRENQAQQPALPMPSQQGEWLPVLREYEDVVEGSVEE